MVRRFGQRYPHSKTSSHPTSTMQHSPASARPTPTNYPAFSNWAHYLYTLVSQVLLITVVIVRTLHELPPRLPWSGFQWFDLTIGVAICVSVVLYLLAFHGWRSPWRRAGTKS
jgi:hypothetical protein